MREIKFRVWDKDNDRMESVEEIKFISRNSEPYKVFVGYGEQVYNFVLMQFTGLYDKNGKEIFHGDIVNWEGEIAKVIWFHETGFGLEKRFGVGTQTSSHLGTLLPRERIEVIGNFFENPELLEPDVSLEFIGEIKSKE